MTFDEFNKLSQDDCINELMKCCTSGNWCAIVAQNRPYNDINELKKRSGEIWHTLDDADYKDAFEGHPKIGDVNSLKEKYANTRGMAGHEQSGMDSASDDVIQELARLNSEYENKYGYIFIVCATGKSAQEMLDILKSRMNNDARTEMKIAAGEQDKITNIRLEKLLCHQ